jgi:hypothetical protein
MDDASKVAIQQLPKRIGILLADMGKFNRSIPVLKYLVLHMNTLQKTFEYEFLPDVSDDMFLQMLANQASVDREETRQAVPAFLERYQSHLQKEIRDYHVKDMELPVARFILISTACFNDNYYTMRKQDLSVIALGNWRNSMAPPSLVEFILTLILRESVAFVSPSLSGSVHIGTKGCLCDFTASLGDARLKVLNGFVCSYCRAALKRDGFSALADELKQVLKKDWLGSFLEPHAPVRIAANLGYDLFITKGFTTRWWERIRALLTEEVLKQFIATVGSVVTGIVIAYLIIRFGLNH